MKKVLTLLFVLCIAAGAVAQVIAYKGMDSNPRLNEAESAYLQPIFPKAIFSFHDKHVGFKYLSIDTVEHTSGLYHVTKQHYFTKYDNGQHQYAYRLYILSNAERKKTNGYEAVVLFTEKHFEGKLLRIKGPEIIKFFQLNYPEIPDDAGSDNSPVLNRANADFFYALYKKRVPAGFDFYNKKIAIINTYEMTDGPQRVGIGEYVARVRESLLLRETYNTDFIYLLTEDQKKQSGGYDVIIRYTEKKDMPLDSMVRLLEQTNQPTETR